MLKNYCFAFLSKIQNMPCFLAKNDQNLAIFDKKTQFLLMFDLMLVVYKGGSHRIVPHFWDRWDPIQSKIKDLINYVWPRSYPSPPHKDLIKDALIMHDFLINYAWPPIGNDPRSSWKSALINYAWPPIGWNLTWESFRPRPTRWRCWFCAEMTSSHDHAQFSQGQCWQQNLPHFGVDGVDTFERG